MKFICTVLWGIGFVTWDLLTAPFEPAREARDREKIARLLLERDTRRRNEFPFD